MSPGEPTTLRPGLLVRATVVILLAGVVLAWGRAVVESRRFADWGDEAVAGEDWQSAVLHYRHAVQWHAPIGSASQRAFDALIAIGDERREAGDTEGALIAYRSARFGTMATRHVWTPRAAQLPELHQTIGALMAEQTGDTADAERFTAQLDAWRDRAPNPVLGLLASAGFAAWLGALVVVALRGFEPDGTVRRAPLVRWSAVSVVALAFWLVCVRFA